MRDDSADDGEVTIAEAASILGVSDDTIRRRLKRGELEGRQVPTQHGPAWRIRLSDAEAAVRTVRAAEPRPAEGQPLAELVRLVEHLQAENRAMVERLQEENRNLAGQLGYYQAKLHQAEDTIRALEAPREAPADAPESRPGGPERAESGGMVPESSPAPSGPWWRRWPAALLSR